MSALKVSQPSSTADAKRPSPTNLLMLNGPATQAANISADRHASQKNRATENQKGGGIGARHTALSTAPPIVSSASLFPFEACLAALWKACNRRLASPQRALLYAGLWGRKNAVVQEGSRLRLLNRGCCRYAATS